MEFEDQDLSDSVQEVVWLRRLLLELQVYTPSTLFSWFHAHAPKKKFSVTIYCDNQGAIKLAQNLVFHARSKHIEMHYHFVQEQVLEGKVTIKYIKTNSQPADAFTKPLGSSL
jgi:hypothetical protein